MSVTKSWHDDGFFLCGQNVASDAVNYFCQFFVASYILSCLCSCSVKLQLMSPILMKGLPNTEFILNDGLKYFFSNYYASVRPISPTKCRRIPCRVQVKATEPLGLGSIDYL